MLQYRNLAFGKARLVAVGQHQEKSQKFAMCLSNIGEVLGKMQCEGYSKVWKSQNVDKMIAKYEDAKKQLARTTANCGDDFWAVHPEVDAQIMNVFDGVVDQIVCIRCRSLDVAIGGAATTLLSSDAVLEKLRGASGTDQSDEVKTLKATFLSQLEEATNHVLPATKSGVATVGTEAHAQHLVKQMRQTSDVSAFLKVTMNLIIPGVLGALTLQDIALLSSFLERWPTKISVRRGLLGCAEPSDCEQNDERWDKAGTSCQWEQVVSFLSTALVRYFDKSKADVKATAEFKVVRQFQVNCEGLLQGGAKTTALGQMVVSAAFRKQVCDIAGEAYDGLNQQLVSIMGMAQALSARSKVPGAVVHFGDSGRSCS